VRVAYYAPLKSPDHPVPSGDRRVARFLMAALSQSGHNVELACRLRSRDGTGDSERQARLAALGARMAEALLRRYRTRLAAKPDAWLTYHLYYKAPDWIGPRVAKGLGIPYVVAEASLAPKRAEGPWAAGHAATLAALDQAEAIIALNPADVPALDRRHRIHALAPFLDPEPYRAAASARARIRRSLAQRHALDPDVPWLLAVAMMRPGDKLASYRALAEAAASCCDRPWSILIAGDGAARAQVEAAFDAVAPGRARFLGLQDGDALAEVLAACDLFVWPAINEAYGMALLEAQAAGLPVLAGASGGVPSIVADGETGVLVPPGDTPAFARALVELLDDPERRRRMGMAAQARVIARHSLDSAATRLDAILREACAR
jgi:glycosyltransferase involved in cell wall biosynthesis